MKITKYKVKEFYDCGLLLFKILCVFLIHILGLASTCITIYIYQLKKISLHCLDLIQDKIPVISLKNPVKMRYGCNCSLFRSFKWNIGD